jgi:hypothetical protein
MSPPLPEAVAASLHPLYERRRPGSDIGGASGVTFPTRCCPDGQEKSTVGAVRTDSSWTSKYSAWWKPNMPAMTLDGNDSTRVLSARTLAL